MSPTGRPMDATKDELVVAITLDLLKERGYGGLRINDISERSGVAKTTIYRRWPSMASLAVSAMQRMLPARLPSPTGDVIADLYALVDAVQAALDAGGPSLIAMALDIARQNDDALLETYRRTLVQPMRNEGLALVRAGIDQGLFFDDVDPAQVIDSIFGAMMYRIGMLNERVSLEQAREHVRTTVRVISQTSVA